MQETAFSERFKRFLAVLAILTVVSLIVMNDATTILESEEAFNILKVQQQLTDKTPRTVAFFPNTSQLIIYSLFDFSPFWIRMSNVVVFLLLLLGIRVWGARIFGKRQIVIFIILMVSSFLMIPISKFAVADLPLCAFHMMSFIFLVFCLKQPKAKWQIIYGLFVMGSFLVQPKLAVIYGIALLAYLMIIHKNARNLRKPIILGVWLGLGSLFYFLGGFEWNTQGFIFSHRSSWSEYFLWQLIGILPWLGFLPAALWDLFKKLRKGEEMAIILLGWLLVAIASHVLILQLVLLFLISKQVELYFSPNYPHKNLVKVFSIINLVFSFFAALFLMIGGFAILHNVGFNSTVTFSAIYWVFGVVGVVGLFAESKRMIIGGISMAGALSMLLFWVQINPIVDKFRDTNRRIFSNIDPGSTVAVSEALMQKNQFKVYRNAGEVNTEPFQGVSKEFDSYILNEADYQLFLKEGENDLQVDTMIGRLQVFEKGIPVYIIK